MYWYCHISISKEVGKEYCYFWFVFIGRMLPYHDSFAVVASVKSIRTANGVVERCQMKKHQSRSSEVCAEWREHPGGCDCYQLSLNVFHRAFCVATKNHIKGGRGSFETPPLWENRRQKTATQINYKLSRVERDAAYVGSALCETHKVSFVKTATICGENKNIAVRRRRSSVL